MGHFPRLLVAALAVWLAGSALPEAQRALRDQTIFVSVTDRQGRPAEALLASELTIREDGNAREILKVEKATAPLEIAVLIDSSDVTQGATPDLREAISTFAAAIWKASPESQIALYTFGERPTLQADFTTSAVALGRGVDRLFAVSGSGAYFVEAVVEAANALARRKPARAAIVAFVDENGPEFSTRRHDQAMAAVAAARASLWTIARESFNDNPMVSETRERSLVLGDVTQRSGGQNAMIFAPSALKARFGDIAAQLLGQFAVTYGRPESLIPPERLEVRLSKDGYRLAAPRWTNK